MWNNKGNTSVVLLFHEKNTNTFQKQSLLKFGVIEIAFYKRKVLLKLCKENHVCL